MISLNLWIQWLVYFAMISVHDKFACLNTIEVEDKSRQLFFSYCFTFLIYWKLISEFSKVERQQSGGWYSTRIWPVHEFSPGWYCRSKWQWKKWDRHGGRFFFFLMSFSKIFNVIKLVKFNLLGDSFVLFLICRSSEGTVLWWLKLWNLSVGHNNLFWNLFMFGRFMGT